MHWGQDRARAGSIRREADCEKKHAAVENCTQPLSWWNVLDDMQRDAGGQDVGVAILEPTRIVDASIPHVDDALAFDPPEHATVFRAQHPRGGGSGRTVLHQQVVPPG